MTAIRRQKLLDEMLGYLAELIDQDEELYNVLHGTIGMTNADIRDRGDAEEDYAMDDDASLPEN